MAAVTLGCRARAALLADGRVQTFGDAKWGGDARSSTVSLYGDGLKTQDFHVFSIHGVVKHGKT